MDWCEIIETIENELGISEQRGELAKRLGIRTGIITDIKNGKAKNPGSNIALLFINQLGVNPKWLETGEPPIFSNELTCKPFDVRFFPGKRFTSLPDGKTNDGVSILDQMPEEGLIIPLLDQAVSAGYGKGLEEDSIPDRFITVPRDLARFPALKALPVRGDSMSPSLHEGDLVVCDSGGWDGDGIYVIKTHDSAYVKRVVQTSKGFTVISDNKAYPTYSENKEDVEIVGKVRCAVVRLK